MDTETNKFKKQTEVDAPPGLKAHLGEIASVMTEQGHELIDDVTSKLQSYAKRVETKSATATDEASSFLSSTFATVKKYPFRVAVMALGAGYLATKALRSKLH